MSYLLDTNHWSYIQRKSPAVLQRLAQISPDADVFMPVVAQAELLAGIEVLQEGRRKKHLRKLYGDTLPDQRDILPIDSDVVAEYVRITVQLQRAGAPIGANDTWIAAIALANDLTLVSSDSHFARVEGPRLEDWTSG